jgi:putative pyruvate formate lyase activating enzyme
MAPGYLALFESGELQNRIDKARDTMKCCTICPRNCQVDRIEGTLGICGVGELAPVSSYGPHFGEEKPLVGQNGSGTIFFASCNLLCIFCQNYEISHFDEKTARHMSDDELAEIMVNLQQQGCHNINMVTPTHVVPQILTALPEAIKRGLKLPLIYNSSGYDSLATLELLDGVVDIYMPDFKFWKNSTADTFTNASDYPEIARAAIKTMHSQVGDLVVDDKGIAVRGLLIRHLVMPDHLDETARILSFIVREISPQCHVNIMDQYRPCGQAVPPIDRPLSGKEFQEALDFAKGTELTQLNENRLADLLKQLGIP